MRSANVAERLTAVSVTRSWVVCTCSGITEAKERLKAANATFLSSFKEHVEGPKDADAATAMDTS